MNTGIELWLDSDSMKKKILLVGATTLEIAGIASRLGVETPFQGGWVSTIWKNKRVYLLGTGIGLVNTAIHLTNFLGHEPVDHIVQFGIGGSFSSGPGLETVVEVVEDCFGDLGAESAAGFLDLAEMGFENFQVDGTPYFNVMSNPHAGASGLKTCKGISVNRVHGKVDSIREVEQKWGADVESMEGAALFQVCLLKGIAFTQLRGISNKVEERNKSNWKIKEAVSLAQNEAMKLLDVL